MPPRPSHRVDLKPLRKRLLGWYRREKRDLPWRKTSDPYRILVSEIMLQQTQVVTVIPYYRRFIHAYPTVVSLARAPLQQVLKLWEGLGYYSRARNLHRTAQAVRDQWRGKIPSTIEGLSSLPGIGRYTAGAVASIAFDLKAPILDGNVRRVLCRIFGIRKDPRQAAVLDRLWRLAAEILPDKKVGDFNQAMMELGALVCAPQSPDCPRCPLSEHCRAYQTGSQDRIPVRIGKQSVPRHRMLVALIQSTRGILFGPRPEKGLLAGLWSFPEMEWTKLTKPRRIEMAIEQRLGLKIRVRRPLEPVTQTFSHKQITYHPILFDCFTANLPPPPPWRWMATDRLNEYPMPNATRKIYLKIIEENQLPLAAEQPSVYHRPKT